MLQDESRRAWPLVRPWLAIPEPHAQNIRNICEHFFHELEGLFLGVIVFIRCIADGR
jgi:hypothetical protein